MRDGSENVADDGLSATLTLDSALSDTSYEIVVGGIILIASDDKDSVLQFDFTMAAIDADLPSPFISKAALLLEVEESRTAVVWVEGANTLRNGSYTYDYRTNGDFVARRMYSPGPSTPLYLWWTIFVESPILVGEGFRGSYRASVSNVRLVSRPQSVPESGVLALLGLGFTGLGLSRWWIRRHYVTTRD
ncbi:MAG: hypothetical protein ACR2PZ_10120 [Pseudomonadales bacterium]